MAKENKLEELRNLISNLFDQATEKSVIEKGAIAQQKITEIEEEKKQQEEEYNSLLKDYKDVVLHSSFKPNMADKTGANAGDFNPESAFDEFFLKGKK